MISPFVLWKEENMKKGKKIAFVVVTLLAMVLLIGFMSQIVGRIEPGTKPTPTTTNYASTVTPEGMVRDGRNLLDSKYYRHYDGKTVSGVEISIGREGEIVLNGTSTEPFYLNLGYFKEDETAYYREIDGPYCLGSLPLPIIEGDPPYYVMFPKNCSMGIYSPYEGEGHNLYGGTYHWYDGAYWDETSYPYINQTTEPEYIRFKVDKAGVIFDNFVLRPFLYYFDDHGNCFLKNGFTYYKAS